MKRNLTFIILWTTLIATTTLFIEWKQVGSMHLIYKPSISPVFFLDTQSDFFRLYHLEEADPIFVLRKIGHFCFYSVVTLVFFFSNHTKGLFVRGILSFSSTVLIGLIDEYHQFFIAGRSGLLLDVWVDAIGSFCTVTVLSLCYLIYSGVALLVERLQSNV